MIEQADRQLGAWIKDILGEVEVILDPPIPNRTGCGVSCYLLALADTPLSRAAPNATLRLELRYLITTYAANPEDAHHLLWQLVSASMDHPDWVRDLEPLPADLWTAFGVAPQPGFVLRIPLHWERVEPGAKRVRTPLEVQPVAMGKFQGVLLGPGDQPVAFAAVALPDLQLTTMTNPEGCFFFPAVPLWPRTRRLLIRAKGQVFNLQVEQFPSDEEANEIRLELFEGKE